MIKKIRVALELDLSSITGEGSSPISDRDVSQWLDYEVGIGSYPPDDNPLSGLELATFVTSLGWNRASPAVHRPVDPR